MSACSQMWMDEVERITDEFAFDRLTRDEAMNRLSRLGLDGHEAQAMLDEAVS